MGRGKERGQGRDDKSKGDSFVVVASCLRRRVLYCCPPSASGTRRGHVAGTMRVVMGDEYGYGY